MSLLLDALNRASKEKQKAAAAASQAEAPVTVSAPLAAPVAPPSAQPAQPTSVAVSPDPMAQPVESLKWEEIPPLAPVPEQAAPAETPRASPPVLTASVPSGSELELTLVGATPVSEPALEPAPPAVPPEVSTAARFAPPPASVTAPEPAASTPREPTLEAPVTPVEPVVLAPTPPPPPSETAHVPTPPAPAGPVPPAPPPQAPLGLAPAAAPKPVPDGQKAQDIRRAYEGPTSDARKGRRRVMALGGLAVGLALAFGSVFLGLWGDPAKWLGGSGLSTVAPPTPVAAEEPSTPAVSAEATEPAASGAVPAAEAPAAVASASAPTPEAVVQSAPAATSTAPAVGGAATKPTMAAAPASTTAAPAVSPNTIANTSANAIPVSIGNEVVLRGSARTNPSFESKTRGPSALEQGYTLLLQGRLDEAQSAYGQALRANADERDALLGMAYISQQKGQRDDAQSYYRRVLRQEPNNARALAALQALDSGSDLTLSASRAGDLAARQPDSAVAMAMAGNAFVRDGLLSNAAQAYARAQILEPTNPLHAYNHAVALDRLGRYAQAVVQYERVLALSATAPVAERAYQIEDVRLRLAQLHQALAASAEPTAP